MTMETKRMKRMLGLKGVALMVALSSGMSAIATEPIESDSSAMGRSVVHHVGMDFRGAYVAPARGAVENTYYGTPARDAGASSSRAI